MYYNSNTNLYNFNDTNRLNKLGYLKIHYNHKLICITECTRIFYFSLFFFLSPRLSDQGQAEHDQHGAGPPRHGRSFFEQRYTYNTR